MLTGVTNLWRHFGFLIRPTLQKFLICFWHFMMYSSFLLLYSSLVEQSRWDGQAEVFSSWILCLVFRSRHNSLFVWNLCSLMFTTLIFIVNSWRRVILPILICLLLFLFCFVFVNDIKTFYKIPFFPFCGLLWGFHFSWFWLWAEIHWDLLEGRVVLRFLLFHTSLCKLFCWVFFVCFF